MSIWSQLASLAQGAFSAGRAETAQPEPGAAAPGRGGCTDMARPGEAACGPDPGDVDFTAAVVGLGAKLAKADGYVTQDEVAAFSRVFRAAPRDEAAVSRVFNIARQTVAGYEGYARRIARRYGDRPCLLEGVLDGLFQIAIADGALTGEELDYIRTVSDAFGFDEADFRRIKAGHMGAEPDDPYLILGVPYDAGLDEVKSAYRRLMRDHHPDVMVSTKLAPREFEPLAHEKAAAITGAYARIRAERGQLVTPE